MPVFSRRFLVAPALAAVLLASGCSYTIQARPDAFPVEQEGIPAYQAGVAVSITNQYSTPEVVNMTTSVAADVKQFGDVAIAILQRELTTRGLVMAAQADRTMQVRIANPNWLQGSFGATGTVRLEAMLGNGKKVTVYGEARTLGDVTRIFNAAIARAAGNLLKEPDVVAYLNPGAVAQP